MTRDTNPQSPRSPLRLATDHLEQRGHVILDSELKRQPFDLVSQQESLIVFTTVRQYPSEYSRADYVTDRQRVTVRKAAATWLAAHPSIPEARELRFDSIGITVNETGRLLRLDHVKSLY
jgi:putative endonuclease